MGLDPSRIGYLSQAARLLGQGDLEHIVQAGEDPERDGVDLAVLPPFEGLKAGSDSGGSVDAGQA